jgi:hypothetical protein
VKIDQAPEKPGAKPGTMTATGDHMEYATSGPRPTLTLTGNVKMSGQTGPSSLLIEGPMQSVVLNLNAKGQMIGASGK